MTTIAVIDDDPGMLELMSDLLDEYGARMLALPDSRLAVPSIHVALPDAIVLDIRLGSGESGWDILQTLRADPITSSIPVILWSADVRALETKPEWLAQQSVLVLPKPFNINDLFACLDAALNTEPIKELEGIEAAG